MEYYAYAITTMTEINNNPFQLNAIDLAPWGYGQKQGSFTVEFIGTKFDGSTVRQTFTMNSDGLTPVLKKFSFGNEFTDLVQVAFRQGNFPMYGTAYQFNNVVINSNLSASCTDTDGDGVADQWDTCPNTHADSYVDKKGCPASGLYTQEQVNKIIEAVLLWGDIDGDRKISLPEAVHALQVTSGITAPAIK